MTAGDIGSITGIVSIGGLVTALVTGNVAAVVGRRKAALLSCIPFIIGSLLTGAARNVWEMEVGRFISGLGAGAAIVVTPLYLSEIGPPHLRARLGFMNQVSINVGILIAQVLGIFFSSLTRWRLILFFGAVLGVVYAVCLSLFLVESPKWYVSVAQHQLARKTLQYLRDSENVEQELNSLGSITSKDDSDTSVSTNEETQALLDTTVSAPETTLIPAINIPAKEHIVSVQAFLFASEHRRQLIVVAGVMMAQQFCGINSIIFYGVSVLEKLFPELTTTINCIISVLNMLVTMYSSTIVDQYGRKQLLIFSISGMAIFSTLLGFGINNSYSILSALSATFFVVTFAIGLGPIPFMLVSELVPHNAVGAAQSVGTTANWLSTFAVGYFFPIFQAKLGGNTYYLFTCFCLLSITFIWTLVPSTSGGEDVKVSAADDSE